MGLWDSIRERTSATRSSVPRSSVPFNPARWSRVTPGATLKLHGLAACGVSLCFVLATQVISFLLVYRADQRTWWLPVTVIVAAVISNSVGVLGLWRLQSTLLSLHTVLAQTLAAACAAMQVLHTWQLYDRCSLQQFSFPSCEFCECSATNQCTAALIQQDRSPRCVSGCRAWGQDLCSNAATYLPMQLAFAGVVLCLLALPAHSSQLLLMRQESTHGNLDNKVQYARNLLSIELASLETNQSGSLDTPILLELLRTLLAYSGQDRDISLVTRVTVARGLDSRRVLGLAKAGKDPVLDAVALANQPSKQRSNHVSNAGLPSPTHDMIRSPVEPLRVIDLTQLPTQPHTQENDTQQPPLAPPLHGPNALLSPASLDVDRDNEVTQGDASELYNGGGEIQAGWGPWGQAEGDGRGSKEGEGRKGARKSKKRGSSKKGRNKVAAALDEHEHNGTTST